MSHIFVSYSTKNAAYAHRFADSLREAGFDVWIDNARLRSSENWWEKIVLALNGRAAVVVVIKPEARASKWVQREVTLADNWSKPTFPLLADGDNWEIFVLTQYEDVRNQSLPRPEFYDALADVAPRQAKLGTDVTQASMDATAVVQDRELAKEIANPPPVGDATLLSSLETPAAFKVVATNKPPVTRQTGIAILGTLIALLIVGVLFLNNRNQNSQENSVTATGTTATQISAINPQPPDTQIAQVATLTAPPTTAKPMGTATTHVGPSPAATPTPRPTVVPLPTLTRTPTASPTVDLALAVQTLDAQSTQLVRQTDTAATATEKANRTATADAWTDTPTPTLTPTPNYTASIAAFLTQRADYATATAHMEETATATLWTYTPTSTYTPTNTATFTDTPTNTLTPTNTPQGGGSGEIVFSVLQDGDNEIYVLSLNTSSQYQLTKNTGDDAYPIWSPDGQQIAFSARQDSKTFYQIYIMNADGTGTHQITVDNFDHYAIDWSPDRSQLTILYNGMNDGVPISQYAFITLATGQSVDVPNDSNGNDHLPPRFSPDKFRLVYGKDGDIYVSNADGSHPNNLTNSSAIDYEPHWSPDGNHIVFVTDLSIAQQTGIDISVMNADGTNVKNLTQGKFPDAPNKELPEWSPDGGQIIFKGSSKDFSSSNIYIMNADGSRLRVLIAGNAADWRPAVLGKDDLTNVIPISTLSFVVMPTVVGSPTPKLTQIPTPTSNAVTVRICGTQERVNIRSGPGGNYPVVRAANQNEILTLTGRLYDGNDYWFKIIDGTWISWYVVCDVTGHSFKLPFVLN